ncbi:hypothetical protein ABTM06_19525, partial [Acinetobacter baumannii]
AATALSGFAVLKNVANPSDPRDNSYDGLGNITAKSSSMGSLAVPQAGVLSGYDIFAYNDYYRPSVLTGESSQRAGGYSNSFAFDLAGNPTTFR